MWWKIYFWIYLLGNSLGVIIMLGDFQKANLFDIILILSGLPVFYSLYIYVFKKKHTFDPIWRYVFWFYVLMSSLSIIQLFAPTQLLAFVNSGVMIYDSKLSAIIGLFFELPAFYALYIVGQKPKK